MMLKLFLNSILINLFLLSSSYAKEIPPSPLGTAASAATSIQNITPSQGPITGGTQVTLAGSGFTGTTLTLDGTAVTPSSASDTQIVFRTPVHDNGIVTLKLSGNGPTAYVEFLYVPPRLRDLPPGYITTVAGVGLFTGLYRQATQAEIQPQGSPAFDRQGNMYIPEPGNNRVTRVRPDGILEPFAGSGIPEYQSTSGIGDGGPAVEASLTFPRGVTTDATGNVYITEYMHRIRRVDAQTGIITTIAGNGTAGFSGDGGPAVQARLNDVSHITGDGNGTLFFIDFDDASCVARIRKITPDGIISTVAGIGPEGFSGDGGPATQAQFNLIMADNGSLALDPQGNLFIVDTGNQRIRRIDGRSGIITTVFGPASRGVSSVACDSAGNIYFDNNLQIVKMSPSGQILATYGNGQQGISEDGTPATDAFINGQPGAVDSLGNIIFLERETRRVRRINVGTGRLETLAGMKSRSIGESGPAIATTLQISNAGLAFLPSGELLVGDGGHNMIRKIDANGTISTFGQGGYPNFPEGKGWGNITNPISVKTDPSGQVFVADTRKVFRIDVTGQVRMIAGTGVWEQYGYSGDGGPATEALLCQPWDVALDGAGNLFIADTNNNRIRRVDARTGIITTVAGSGPVNGFEHYGSDGHGSFSGDGGPATQATLNTPYGVAVDAQGNLFIADGDNGRIRKVDTKGIITTIATNGVDKLAFDGAGNLYSLSGAGLIRYDPTGRSTQLIGQGSPGFSGDGGPALQSKTRTHAQSASVAIDAEGNVFFIDAGNLRVRAVRYGAVLAEPGSFQVTSPNGGESWVVGSSHNITWTSTGTIANVKIESSTNNGTSYSTIIASTPNNGNYAWTVPNTPSTQCLVRVSESSTGTPTDVSNAVFSIVSTILPPRIALSKASLAFGAVAGGTSTSSQPVVVSNSGGGTLAWTAASNQTWLTAAPAAGTGTGTTIISVNPSGLGAGNYLGTITVSDPNASNNPQTIAVALTVSAAGSSALPFGDFSTPIDGTTGITGAVPVTGWVLDDIETTKVAINRDPVTGDPPAAIGPDGLVYLGDAIFVEGARPDVETAYPGYPLNYRAGWGYMMLTNFLPNQGNGTFKIHAFAYDKEGNKTLLGTKTVTCSNATAVKPFGTIDTPAQGGDVSGTTYVNFGWVLTPQPSEVPQDGSTITAWVDGVQVGVLKNAPNAYNQYRADIAGLFPGLKNSGGPVGFVYLNTTQYSNGVHTIYWIAMDDAGHADGIGSRYFNIINTGTSPTQSYQIYQAMNLSGSELLDSVMNLPASFEARRVKKGFDLNAEAVAIQPDEYGVVRIVLGEVERVELDLRPLAREISAAFGASEYTGFLVVGNQLRPLPIGSTLDQRNGTFSWLPGPGFLGEYHFLFLRKDKTGGQLRMRYDVKIIPKFNIN